MPKWLSKSALAALRAAERQAAARHQVVGTPHLLLGLIADSAGAPAQALESMGFSVAQVRAEVARKVGAASGRPRRGRPPYSSRAEAILGAALAEADRQGRSRVEPEDLLVALVTEPGGRAAGVLNHLRGEGEGEDTDRGSDGRVPAAF